MTAVAVEVPLAARAGIAKTSNVHFALGKEGGLMEVAQNMPATEALELARQLTGGVDLLCNRIHDALNDGDDLVYCDEIRAIGFLAQVSSALIQSVNRNMKGGAQ